MTKPATDSVLAAGALALAVVITRIGPAPRAAVASAARSAVPASERSPGDDGEALDRVSRSGLAGIGAFPRDDDSDSDDGGESDDGGGGEGAGAAATTRRRRGTMTKAMNKNFLAARAPAP